MIRTINLAALWRTLLGLTLARLLTAGVTSSIEAQDVGGDYRWSPVLFVKWNSVDGQLYQFESQELGGPWKVYPELLKGQGRESLLVTPTELPAELMRLRKLPGQVTNTVGRLDRLEFDGTQFTYDSNRVVLSNVRASGVAVSTNDYVEMDFERIPGSAAFELRATRIIPDVGVASGAHFAMGTTNAIVGYTGNTTLEERRTHYLNFSDGPIWFRLRTGQALVTSLGSSSPATLRLISPSGRVVEETLYGSVGRVMVQPVIGIYEEGDYRMEIERTGGSGGSFEFMFRNANEHPLEEAEQSSVIRAAFSGEGLREYYKYRVTLGANEIFRLLTELPTDMAATVLDERSVSVDVDTSSGVTFVADRAGIYYVILVRFNREASLEFRSPVSISRLRRK